MVQCSIYYTAKPSKADKLAGERDHKKDINDAFIITYMLSPLLFSLYINGLVVELKRRRCGVECGGLLIPGVLLADDISLLQSTSI